jgi:hypothetical protein
VKPLSRRAACVPAAFIGFVCLAVVRTAFAVPPGGPPQPPPAPDASPTLRGLVNTKAQSFGGFKTFDGGISAPNVVQSTTAAVTYFVDGTLGNDANLCTSSGSGACLTIAGGLSKIPKVLRHLTTLSIAAGTYAGFVVSGFACDEGLQQSSGGLLITSTLATSTLATGSASGTATGGSAGGNQIFGTLINSGATWTTNDLTGRFLCTSNALNCVLIESNTSTTITIVGTTAIGWVTPVGGVTTYQIMDPAAVINTPATLPPGPTNAAFLNAAVSNRAGVIVLDNTCSARSSMVTFQNLRVAPSTGGGFEFGGSAGYALVQVQVRPTASTARGIRSASGVVSGPFSAPNLELFATDIFPSASSNPGIFWDSSSYMSLSGTFIRGISSGGKSQFCIDTATSINFQFDEISGCPNGIRFRGPTTSNSQVGSGRIYCGSFASTVGIAIGNTTTGAGNNTNGVAAQVGGNFIDHIDLAVCDVGVLVDGNSSAEVHGLNGTVGSTIVSAINGGYIGVNPANMTPASITSFDGGGLFANIDNGFIMTDAGTDFGIFQGLGICAVNLGQGTRICGR